MTEDEMRDIVDTLRRSGTDNDGIEAKSAAGKLPKSVWATVSAFANTAGGIVILGLDESAGFSVVQGLDVRSLVNQLVDGLAEGRDSAKISPVPPHRIQTVAFEGAELVVVHVESMRGAVGVRLPCHVLAEGVARGSYTRIHDHDQRLTSYEIHLLENSNRPSRVDRQPVEGRDRSDLDDTLVTALLERLRAAGSRALDHVSGEDEVLERLGILTSNGCPTLAGYLTLGTYPQDEFPQLFIDVTVHSGVTKAAASDVRFLDRKTFDGPLAVAVEDAVRFVLSSLQTRRRVSGLAGEDVTEIPEDVIREAIVNAVVHRDYSTYALGEQVAVDIHPDRVEVTNPGGFVADRDPVTVLDGRSVSRNEVLARLMMNVPIRDGRGVLVENQGSGVARMVAAMRERGLAAPDYGRSAIDHVTLVLRRLPAVEMPEGDLGAQIIELVERHGELRAAEIAERLGRSIGVVRPVLRRLVDGGLLVATAPPTSRRRAYRRGEVPVVEE